MTVSFRHLKSLGHAHLGSERLLHLKILRGRKSVPISRAKDAGSIMERKVNIFFHNIF